MIFSTGVLMINSLRYLDRGVLGVLRPMDCTLIVVHENSFSFAASLLCSILYRITIPTESRMVVVLCTDVAVIFC